jgi:hypothetical protein
MIDENSLQYNFSIFNVVRHYFGKSLRPQLSINGWLIIQFTRSLKIHSIIDCFPKLGLPTLNEFKMKICVI